MKLYDRVKLVKEKKKYTDLGLHVGHEGVILGEKRGAYWLVYFDGEIGLQKEDGTYYTEEIDVACLEEDLEVIG